jgi:signal transduction histidine kinase
MSTAFDGQTYRVYVLTTSLNGVPLRVFVARVLTDNPSLLDRPYSILIRFIPAMLLVSALAGYFISRRALMPVVRLTESARSITIGNLAARLPVSPVGDELARLAETCNEMLSRLEESIKSITRFTADASHELRSPIAFIRIASEDTLRIPSLPAEAIQALESIVSETAHSQQLLEDMLLLARFDAGRAPLNFGSIFLAEIVESVVSRMQVLAAQKNQRLVAQLPNEDLVSAGDAQMFRRLVWILVDNAIKYTPHESVIETTLVQDGRNARLTVSDNGPGISEAHLPHIFDRFFRADPSRGETNGTGLGLAIAKWIAEAHHAQITATSREGAGTIFEVIIPLINPVTPTTNTL